MAEIQIDDKSIAEMATGAGTKNDWGKPKMGQIAPVFLEGIANVLTFGAKKYSAGNWLNGMDWDRPYDALQRHLNHFWNGQEKDDESGLHILDHAGCELMFLRQYVETHRDWDNRLNFAHVRYKKAPFNNPFVQQPIPQAPLPPAGIDLLRNVWPRNGGNAS